MDKATIAFYDSDPEGYAESTIHRDVSASRRAFASLLRPGARILDLGCGSGRDTVAFREEGFLVVPVDGSEGMCRAAETVIGEAVRLLSFEDLDYEDEFDGVWACASLLHLGYTELRDVLVLIRRALRDDGILFASFKKGGYRGYRDGRWYTDLEPEALRSGRLDLLGQQESVEGSAGFKKTGSGFRKSGGDVELLLGSSGPFGVVSVDCQSPAGIERQSPVRFDEQIPRQLGCRARQNGEKRAECCKKSHEAPPLRG